MSGISGAAAEGADSVVVSGGYEDDEDYGDVIVYTGAGGNDTSTKQQIADQELEKWNEALARSCDEGLPVRVVRGAGGDPQWSPATGFRYDGLYRVARYWSDIGRSGFRVFRFELVRLGHEAEVIVGGEPEGSTEPERRRTEVQRIVRSSEVIRWVKALYAGVCQVCGQTVELPLGSYSEGAHVRPLGRPHNGPDVAGNVLCLCPNDHVRFDSGALSVSDSLIVTDTISGEVIGSLRHHKRHLLDVAHLAYHRAHVALPTAPPPNG